MQSINMFGSKRVRKDPHEAIDRSEQVGKPSRKCITHQEHECMGPLGKTQRQERWKPETEKESHAVINMPERKSNAFDRRGNQREILGIFGPCYS